MRLLSSARRTGTALFAAAVLAVLSPGTAHASQVEAYNGDFPDPFVLPVDENGTMNYYAYATNRGDRNVQVMSSTNPSSFSSPGDALPTLGTWASEGWTWAPAVLKVGSQYVLYYTAHVVGDAWLQCIGRAVSSSPAGPFSDTFGAPLVCQKNLGGSIDADAFRDPATGTLYLHWKSDDNAIGGVAKLWGQRLSADGLHLEGSAAQLMKYDQKWEKPLIEAPQMVRANGGYHLFYSGNWWESSNAAVGYGVCSSPVSGCVKKTTRAPWMKKDSVRVGPAGETFFQKPDGSWWVAYHAWDDAVGYGNGGVRSLWVNSVSFATGKPVLTN